MQFKVPQDVQREDNIVGPLTLKQLIILGVGGGVAYAIYTILAKNYYWQIWAPPTAIVVILAIALAFAKIHDLPLIKYLAALTEYLVLPRKRIWIQGSAEAQKPLFEETKIAAKQEPRKEKSLKDLDKLVQLLDSRGVAKKPEQDK